MRLIDADELKKNVIKWLPEDPHGRQEKEEPFATDICVSTLMEIEEAETVDAEPVVHAHWEPFNADDPQWLRDDGKTVFQECSRCHTPYVRNFLNNANYCPNCGAKMDEE